jgi:hypothetical protein
VGPRAGLDALVKKIFPRPAVHTVTRTYFNTRQEKLQCVYFLRTLLMHFIFETSFCVNLGYEQISHEAVGSIFGTSVEFMLEKRYLR